MSDRKKASEVPDRLFYDVTDLARDEAMSLWLRPNDSEYREVNRRLNQLLKQIQKDYGEDALEEVLDGVAATQHDFKADAYKRDRRNLPEPKRPRWASSRKATRSLTAADRSALIRLASSMEKGSAERKAILAGLK